MFNRFYITKVIIVLSDYADVLAWFHSFRHAQKEKCALPPRGGKLIPIFACGPREDLLQLEP